MKRLSKIASVFWIIFYLIVIDVTVNLLIPYPQDPRNTNPTILQRYFEYGRSIEGKLARMTGRRNMDSAPIIAVGWLQARKYEKLPGRVDGTDRKTYVAVYGMSHTKLLGEAMAKLNSNYVIRDVTAPGAVVTWSYSAFEIDRRRAKVDVAILGVMTDSVPMTLTTSGATSYFDLCYPYTYPLYEEKNGAMHAVNPPFMDLAEYRKYFYDQKKWADYRKWLAIHDKFYDPILFRKTILDRSALVRILRRGYSETSRRIKISKVYSERGFNEGSEEVVVLRSIVRKFAQTARETHVIPVIYIVNNQGRWDHLFRVLEPVLARNRIPYLSTDKICPPDDPSLFIARDTHFIPSKDKELAQAMIKIIENEKEKTTFRARLHGKAENLN